MRIISINVNGLRAYDSKGALEELITHYDPDIICIQECKCEFQIAYDIFSRFGYNATTNPSKYKAGYAGVVNAIKESAKIQPDSIGIPEIMSGYGSGRVLTYHFDNFSLVNVYTLNSGGKEDLRIQWNKLFDQYIAYLQQFNPIIIVGDLNVVSGELDYWSDYQSAIDSGPGLYEFEINHFHEMLRSNDLIDTYRYLHPTDRKYSWFSYRGNARELNHGWRIDYCLCSNSLKSSILRSEVLSNLDGSDHSPIIIDL